MEKIYIIGASGFGREIAWLIGNLSDWETAGFIDDNVNLINSDINGIPVKGDIDYLLSLKSEINAVIAIGNPKIRKKIYDKLKNKKNIIFPNIIDKNIQVDDSNKIGIGNILCAGTILTTNITLGDFNHINLSCTIGHDVIFNDFITIYPSVNISGSVKIESFSEIGTGSQIIQGKLIGSNVTIGAGSVVVKNLLAAGTYVGSPAKLIKKGMIK